MDRYAAMCIFALLIGSIGCNQSGQSGGDPQQSSTANSNADPLATTQPGSTLGATPEKAVGEFLEAIRSGNDETAAGLLTPLARQTTSEFNLTVAPPGSPNASFTVAKVEFVTPNKDGAHVLSNWTDIGEDGNKSSHEIIWVLRKEGEGWRIVGSVMKVFPDREPLVLNYEDPLDMQRKLQMVYEEDSKAESSQQPQGNVQPQAKAPTSTQPLR
jgi:hypothetical protein